MRKINPNYALELKNRYSPKKVCVIHILGLLFFRDYVSKKSKLINHKKYFLVQNLSLKLMIF